MTSTDSQRDEIDAEISRLLAEIAELAERIRVLKAKRNELSIAADLPNEIIYTIFAPYPSERVYRTGDGKPTSWIVATAVCRRWRNAVLQEPRLWGEIHRGDTPKQIIEKLRLSRSTPLSIDIGRHLPPPKMQALVETLDGCLTFVKLSLHPGISALGRFDPFLKLPLSEYEKLKANGENA